MYGYWIYTSVIISDFWTTTFQRRIYVSLTLVAYNVVTSHPQSRSLIKALVSLINIRFAWAHDQENITLNLGYYLLLDTNNKLSSTENIFLMTKWCKEYKIDTLFDRKMIDNVILFTISWFWIKVLLFCFLCCWNFFILSETMERLKTN